jgi:hypothetical protein
MHVMFIYPNLNAEEGFNHGQADRNPVAAVRRPTSPRPGWPLRDSPAPDP